MEAKSLFRLNVSLNQITSVPIVVFHLKQLDLLDISHNAITELPADMWYAPVLRSLLAGHNKISSLPVGSRMECRRPGRHSTSQRAESEVISSSYASPGDRTSYTSFPAFQSIRASHGTGGSDTTSGVGSMDQRGSTNTDDEVESHSGSSNRPELVTSLSSNSSSTRSGPVRGHRQSVGAFARRTLADSSGDDEPSDDEGESLSSTRHRSLRVIELMDNELTSVPMELPCLAPDLQKLMLARNRISEILFPRGFPATLKNLDLSHNMLKKIVASRDVGRYLCCRLKSSAAGTPMNSSGRYRVGTKLTSRHPTVSGLTTPDAQRTSLCNHRKHGTLAKLSTLLVSHHGDCFCCSLNITNWLLHSSYLPSCVSVSNHGFRGNKMAALA